MMVLDEFPSILAERMSIWELRAGEKKIGTDNNEGALRLLSTEGTVAVAEDVALLQRPAKDRIPTLMVIRIAVVPTVTTVVVATIELSDSISVND